MYTLMVSHNAGITYYPDRVAETLGELRPRMAELDSKWLRWYVEDNKGQQIFEVPCKIHADLCEMMQRLNRRVEKAEELEK